MDIAKFFNGVFEGHEPALLMYGRRGFPESAEAGAEHDRDRPTGTARLSGHTGYFVAQRSCGLGKS